MLVVLGEKQPHLSLFRGESSQRLEPAQRGRGRPNQTASGRRGARATGNARRGDGRLSGPRCLLASLRKRRPGPISSSPPPALDRGRSSERPTMRLPDHAPRRSRWSRAGAIFSAVPYPWRPRPGCRERASEVASTASAVFCASRIRQRPSLRTALAYANCVRQPTSERPCSRSFAAVGAPH